MLKMAKKEKKMIFVDCYTSWCGPCKMLAKNIFTQDSVADFYNANFICFQIDMEKGEGPELARKYGVAAFPTLLYVDKDGMLKHCVVGYLQTHELILNGENKGKTISFTNEYTYTGMMKQPYHRGDKVLLNGTSKRMGSGIRGLKRDTELMILVGFLMFVLITIAGRQGALTILTVIFNVTVFSIGFWKAGDTSNVLEMCSRLVILFAVITLVGLNGIHKKTWAALFTTLIVLVMIMGIFDVVIHHAEDLDYSTMEYLGSIENPDEIFHAEILISGLGAIMDVAVAIAASLSEIVEKKSEVTFLELFKSGREIGYDIMGTMINVLLFVFGCGLIPMCLIRMNNDVSLITIIKLHIPCELCRFLVESIGIVLAIPISILVTSVMIKVPRMFRRQKKARKVQGERKC